MCVGMKLGRSCVVFCTMKNHTTVTITKKMLLAWGACEAGIQDMSDFLPAKLSTDPGDNTKLAIKLVEVGREWRLWTVLKFVTSDEFRSVYAEGEIYTHDNGKIIIAQQRLADIADAIATAAGRRNRTRRVVS